MSSGGELGLFGAVRTLSKWTESSANDVVLRERKGSSYSGQWCFGGWEQIGERFGNSECIAYNNIIYHALDLITISLQEPTYLINSSTYSPPTPPKHSISTPPSTKRTTLQEGEELTFNVLKSP